MECSRRCLVAATVGMGLTGPVLLESAAEAAGRAVIATAKVPVGGGVSLAEGDELTLDGDSACVYRGRLPVVSERPDAEPAELARWRAMPAGDVAVEA